ncbi:MAG: PAS domain S-box protein [Chloroflexi bacterium]|nr:PAS domain S-box protein [Chloroflexota bacterium]
MKNKNTRGNLSPRLLILIFVLLAAGIIVVGYLFYDNYKKHYRAQVEQQLSAIADLKVGELVQWRKERLGDANLLYKNPAFSSLVQRYFEQPDDVDVQEQLRSWLVRFQAYDQYAGIFLLDAQGAARISVPDTAGLVPRHILQDAKQVLQSGKLTMLDLERDEDYPQPHMVILTPIFKEKDSNMPLGVVAMRIDPYQSLYPLIQKWPTPSTTAETLIVRRDGNDALFLNELRFQKDTALKLRSSLDNIKMPAVQAALGHEGIMEGIDYRGVPVIADVRAIPDSPWFMVTRMDTSEVYAPLMQMLWLIIALVGALLIGAGTAVILVWRQHNIRVYKERAEIANELRESELRYRDLVNYSKNGVAIYEATADGEDFIFKDFNRAAEGIDNVKKEDIIGKSVLHAFPGIKEFGLFEVFQRVSRTGVPERHPITQYHDKRISGWRDNYVYRLSSGEIVAIYEDVTARKQAEEALRESEAKYRSLVETAGAGVASVDLQGNLTFVNNTFIEMMGYTGEELAGKPFLNFIHPDDRKQMQDKFLTGLEKPEDRPDLEFRALQKNGNYVWLYSSPTPVIIEGNLTGFTAIATDITDRKNTESQLLVSHDQLRNLAARLQISREDERKNIAVEIHDDLGQSLTALQIDLAWLIKRMPPDQEKLLEKAKSMLRLVKVTDQKVREIATDLRPPLLDDLGFVPAAQSYLREFEERTGIKCEYSNEQEEIILDANVSIALFRVLQGALTNTAKHSSATRVKISLVEQTDGLYMEISDNGRGITEKEIASRKSIGIIGMRERIAFFGGSLQIEGGHGKGTTVKVKIPVQGEMFE